MARGYDAAKARAIGAKIREARKARGYAGRDVAEAVGISMQHLYRIEKGTRMAPVLLLNKLAQHLGVEMDFLIGNDELQKDDVNNVRLPPEARNVRGRDEFRLWLMPRAGFGY